jgi:hypothetical protein
VNINDAGKVSGRLRMKAVAPIRDSNLRALTGREFKIRHIKLARFVRINLEIVKASISSFYPKNNPKTVFFQEPLAKISTRG